MAYGGWIPKRRAILACLERGELSLLDVAIEDILSLWADHLTGVCWASAEKINALAPSDFSYKRIQRSLAKLEKLERIKRWVVRGKRGNYPVLVNDFYVRDESGTWVSTSAIETVDWRDVKFKPVHDQYFNRPSSVRSNVRELGGELVVAVSGVQEVEVRSEKQNRDRNCDTSGLVSKCSNTAKDPWQYTGLAKEKIGKKFLEAGFDRELWQCFAVYQIECHEDGKCYCGGPADFLESVICHFIDKGVLYPPGLLKRKKQIKAIEAAE